jgi:hypothetical protein
MNTSKHRPMQLVLILALSVLASLIVWMVKNESQPTQKMAAILALTGGLLAVSVYRALKQAREARAGLLVEDEMTRERRVLAGARAFHLSLYLWLAIFLFNSKFEDREEMLGIGIMGSAALFGLCWLHLKLRGHRSAHQD